MKKHFTLGKGKYYLNIRSGQNTITIHRADKKEAINTYLAYQRVGKSIEWLGKWNGKKFMESNPPESETSA